MKTHFLLCCFFFLTCLTSTARAGELDSLLAELSSLKDANSLEDLDQKSILCNSIAIVYQGINEQEKARSFFLQAIHFTVDRVTRSGNWDAQNNYDIGYLYKNLAVYESTVGNHDASTAYLKKSELYYNRLEKMLPPEEYDWIMIDFRETQFVQAYHRQAFDEAHQYWLQEKHIIEKLGIGAMREAELYRKYGELFSRDERYEEAEEYFAKSIDIVSSAGKEEVGHTVHNFIHSMLVAQFYQHKHQELQDYLQEFEVYKSPEAAINYVKSESPNTISNFLSNLFILSYSKMKLSDKNYNPEELKRGFEWQKAAFELAEWYTLNHRADNIGSVMGSPANRVLGILTNYTLLDKKDQLDKATVFELLRIADVYQSTRLHLERISYRLNRDLWKKQKELKNKLSFVELKLAEVAQDTMNAGKIDSLREESYQLGLELEELEQRTKRDKLLAEYQVGKEEFQHQLEGYIERTQKNCLTYFTSAGRDSVFVIGITPDTSFVYSRRVSPDFSEEVKEIYTLNASLQLDPEKIDRQNELNHLFYNYLIEPIAPFLSGTELLIYPIGEISYISFDALLDENQNYLVNTYTFQYTTSLFSIINAEPPRKTTHQFRCFYPSDYGTDSLAYLTNALEEVKSINATLGGEIYEGKAASKAIFLKLAAQSKGLHIASHSVLNFDQPYESYILFDAGDREENKLFAYEVFSLTLQAELVALSSCNSARGEVEQGIGVVSLSNAFYFAGVPATISSMWSAQDKSSAEIMQLFYASLYQGASKSSSLRKAKMTYLESADKIRRQPFFWANYVIYGQDDPLYEKRTVNQWKPIGGIMTGLLLIGLLAYRKSARISRASA